MYITLHNVFDKTNSVSDIIRFVLRQIKWVGSLGSMNVTSSICLLDYDMSGHLTGGTNESKWIPTMERVYLLGSMN